MPALKMPYLSLVIMSARFVYDPHELTSSDGATGVSFTLVSNKYVKGKRPIETYVDCVAWNDTAKSILSSCKKGSPVIVYGSLSNHTGAKNDKKKLQLSVTSIQFLALPDENGEETKK